jgi:hypothetical protein
MRRLAGVVVALGLLVAFAAPAAHSVQSDPGLTYVCSPPLPRSEQNCDGWHNFPVTIRWIWDQTVATAEAGQCQDQVFAQDSDGSTTLATCTVVDDLNRPHSLGAVLKIDRTPPVITAATADRPPDNNGWWNRPLSFSFAGSDALSGIASCDTVPYAGPGGPGAQVVGGCHDNAGNYGTSGFALNFDSTPPALSGVKATPASGSATLSWDASPDTVLTQVIRTPGLHGRAPSVVYSGNGRRFTDSGITNGTTYRYTVSAFDPAGNDSSQTVAAKPEISLGLKPPRGARMRRAPQLRWPAVRSASYYNLQLYRGKRKLLTAWPGKPQFNLRRSHHGHRLRLRPGRYHWYVWPGYGSRAAHRYGAFIGQSTFVIVRR